MADKGRCGFGFWHLEFAFIGSKLGIGIRGSVAHVCSRHHTEATTNVASKAASTRVSCYRCSGFRFPATGLRRHICAPSNSLRFRNAYEMANLPPRACVHVRCCPLLGNVVLLAASSKFRVYSRTNRCDDQRRTLLGRQCVALRL